LTWEYFTPDRYPSSRNFDRDYYRATVAYALAKAEAHFHINESTDFPEAVKILSTNGFFLNTKPQHWYDLARVAIRTGDATLAWDIVGRADKRVDPRLMALEKSDRYLCLRDLTLALLDHRKIHKPCRAPGHWQGRLDPGFAELFDWMAVSAGLNLKSSLAELEASGRTDPSKYGLLPSTAGTMHLTLKRIQEIESRWPHPRQELSR